VVPDMSPATGPRAPAAVVVALVLAVAETHASVPRAHVHRRLELLARASRSPILRDPVSAARHARSDVDLFSAGTASDAPSFLATRRALEECRAPFQIVKEGERCTPATGGQQVKMCQAPLRCLSGMCRRLKENDTCHNDAMCDGATSNMDMVCVEGKCAHLLEAGEACSASSQCFSGQCKGDKCTGKAEGESCEYLPQPEGKEIVYQNPCAEGLHCALRGMEDGKQKAICAKPVPLGEPCLGFAVNYQPSEPLTLPPFFLSAYVSAVYAACEPGHVCETSVFPTIEEGGHGTLSYAGTCRRLLHSPPGTDCHSDMVCEPPYSCIGGRCTASLAQCGTDSADWSEDEADEESAARQAALLHGCATNERCTCPGGVGECRPIYDECTREEQRLVECMEKHKCPWVDQGNTQCAEDNCKNEDVAYECCKYRPDEFSENVDWAAMTYMYGRDVHEMCEHIVSGRVIGLGGPRAADRVVLELNGKDDQIVNRDGAFDFKIRVHHMDKFNVTITEQPARGPGCSVKGGEGVALDDVHDVEVNCMNGAGQPNQGGGGGGAAGAIIAAILVPCLLLACCVGGASTMIGQNMGGTPVDGFNSLVGGARRAVANVNLPAVSNPFTRTRDGNAGTGGEAPYTGFLSSPQAFGGGDNGMDPIPQAQVVDAATGLPVTSESTPPLQASAIAPSP